MREVVLMWRDSRMIILTVVVTAAYSAVLIPFKGFVIVPGFTEVRVANALPVVFSLMFGPAAAWGSAFGNLIGDVFGGTLTQGSVFGFVGNFFFGFAGYKLWGNLGRFSCDREPTMESASQVVEFLAIALVSSAGTAAIIAWGLELLGLFPFSVLGTIILVNNFIAVAVLGPPLLRVLYPRAKRDGLLYPDLMRDRDLPTASASLGRYAGAGVAIVALAWIVGGVAISVGLQDVPLGATPGEVPPPISAESGIQSVGGAVALVLLFVASLFADERLSRILGDRDRPTAPPTDRGAPNRATSNRSATVSGRVTDRDADRESRAARSVGKVYECNDCGHRVHAEHQPGPCPVCGGEMMDISQSRE